MRRAKAKTFGLTITASILALVAVAYSLIQTCKLHNVEPFAYLSGVLRRLQSYPINRVAELLPFRWKPAA